MVAEIFEYFEPLSKKFLARLQKRKIKSWNCRRTERIEEEEEQKTYRSKMVDKGHNKKYDFRKFKIIRVFGDDIRTNFIYMYITKP